MKIRHHDVEIDLNDEWWDEAGIAGFVPRASTYSTDRNKYPDVCTISIEDIGPVRRGPGVGIFNDGEEGSARERVVSLLRAIALGAVIPPVEIVENPRHYAHRYKLTHGVHRLYCSLAAGFSHIPTVCGFDWATLDG